MKTIFFFLIAIFHAALALNSCGYIVLSSRTVENSAVIKDLRDLGMEFLVTKAIYNANQPITNAEYGISRTFNVARRISNGVHYFRYKVEIVPRDYNDDFELSLQHESINATYTISFRPKSGKVAVTSYRYEVRFPEEPAELGSHEPGFGNPSTDEGPADYTVEYVVENAIKNGEIREGTYSIGKVFVIYGTKDEAGTVEYLVTLVRSDGYTYRARINESGFLPEDGGNYPEYTIYTNRL